jgi:hypothetical protein
MTEFKEKDDKELFEEIESQISKEKYILLKNIYDSIQKHCENAIVGLQTEEEIKSKLLLLKVMKGIKAENYDFYIEFISILIEASQFTFKIKPRKKPLGICTSSGKIGHSISLGAADSDTVISESSSVADGLATRIANDVKGADSEDNVVNAAETAEEFRELFDGALIICENNVATVGRLPKIVETDKFEVNKI